MEDEFFEHEFEDELDALRDMEMEDNVSPSQTKRGLFVKSTPKRATKLNDSFPTELEQTPDRLGECDSEKRKRAESSPDLTVPNSPLLSEPKRRRVLPPANTSTDFHFDDDLDDPIPFTSPSPLKPLSYAKRKKTEEESNSAIWVKPKAPAASKKKRVLRRIPKGEYIPVTSSDGVRSGYMCLAERKDQSDHQKPGGISQTAASRDLLGVDFQTLKQQVESRRARETLEALDRVKEITAAQDSDLCDEGDQEVPQQQNSRLWVDMYSPRSYIDLMSDEAVNRVLLRWVKMWDYLVFGKAKPVRKMNQPGAPKSKPGGGYKKLDYKEFMKMKYEDLGLDEDYDSLYRPQQKIVLLCGKPGLGKTTLAHVVARHAGYNVIEMNASDERSAQSFKDKIEDSLTMRPLLGVADPRPNCLIIDEIDGAPAPAINALLAKITESGKNTAEQTKKKKSQTSALVRPIICICNDLYTPALRNLRQHALILNFPSQCPSRLATRLLEICKYEGLSTDMSTLMALCRRSSSDIRSCLNTLQFIRRRKSELTMKALMSLGVGSKDEQKSLYTFWQQVFHKPSQSRAMMPSIYDEPSAVVVPDVQDNSLAGRCDTIYREAQACGEFNRLVQGLYENFPLMKFKDPFMRSVSSGAEWLCYTDLLNKKIFSQQAFNLMTYLPYLSVVFHLNFSQGATPKIQYPKVQYEMSQKENQNSSLVTLLCQSVYPNVYTNINQSTLTIDILPLLVDVIIQPNMRPVNIQLYSNSEKVMLKEMVSTMIAYNLTYTQHKNSEGVYTYTLEPPMDEMIKFPEMKQTRKALSYTAKQLIASEVQTEKQRRLDTKARAVNEAATPSSRSTKRVGNESTPQTSKKTPSTHTPSGSSRARTSLADMMSTPVQKQKLVPKNITPSQRGATDFFGRPLDKSSRILSPEALQAQKDTALLHTDIWYKFKEGFSNAVRKKITINDLL